MRAEMKKIQSEMLKLGKRNEEQKKVSTVE